MDIGDSLTETAGGSWFKTAVTQIGTVLTSAGFDISSVDPNSLTLIRRGNSSDIDLYEFSLPSDGSLSAEVLAQRLKITDWTRR